MAENLELLRTEVQHDLEVIARNLEEKYVDYIPMLTESYGDVSSKLNDLVERINDKLNIVEKTMNETDVDAIAQSGDSLSDEIESIALVRGLVSHMGRIEDCLLAVDSTACDIAEKAAKIVEAKNIFQGNQEMVTQEALLEKMSLMLLSHLKHLEALLRAELSECFNSAVSFPSSSSKGVHCMRIAITDRSMFSLVLQSMRTLTMLDGYIEKMTNAVLNNFCSVILSSTDGNDVLEVVNSDADIYLFKSRTKSTNASPTSVEGVVNVLKTLFDFFAGLDLAFSGIQFEHGCMDMKLVYRIGMDIREKLMTMIIKQCVAISIPGSEANGSFSDKTMQAAEEFRLKMIEHGIWSDAIETFTSFAEKNDLILVDRRCLSFLVRGKELIALPLTELETVGVGAEAEKESQVDFVSFFNQNSYDVKHDYAYPKLLQFLECRVSKSVVQFVDLLESTVKEAVDATDKAASARFALTARNLMQLYLQVAPKLHHTDISNIPLVAAVFYNNSYYICHRILMMPFGILKEFNKTSPEYDEIRPIFGESIWKLRSEAAKAIEQMLCTYRRQISTILGGSELFTNLENFENFTACKKSIIACVELVKAAANAWKDVFPETVYCKALGNICSYFMSDVCEKFLEAEDLKTSDCEIAVKVIETLLLKELESVFTIRGHTVIHNACEREYFRTKEVMFCLKGSLQNISDRWCDGKGPLAQWLKPTELRSLIRATFMNTELRKRLIESIL